MVTIIGAGLAGSILSRLLYQNKIKHQLFDCEKPWRASVISENLFSLTWKDTLGDKVLSNGLKTLERIVDIKTIHFKTKAGYNDVLHVHPSEILMGYEKREVDHTGEYYNGKKDFVIDCRGFWAGAKVSGITGQGLFIGGTLVKADIEPTMNFVSPYVHQKLFQWDKKRMWYGDSTCIEHTKYLRCTEEYVNRCVARAERLIGFANFLDFEVVHGIRPVVKGHKGFLQFKKNNLIVNTGGWKCGLIIYADHAQKIVEHLKRKL